MFGLESQYQSIRRSFFSGQVSHPDFFFRHLFIFITFHACLVFCSLWLLFVLLLHLCQPINQMGRKRWSQTEVPWGWLQVIRGPRPRSQQWPSVQTNVQTSQRELLGRWRAELTRVRAASKQPAVELEIDQCRKFIVRPERQIRELDTRARGVCSEEGGPGASREVVGSAVPRPLQDATSGSRATSDVTSADSEHVAGRTRCGQQDLLVWFANSCALCCAMFELHLLSRSQREWPEVKCRRQSSTSTERASWRHCLNQMEVSGALSRVMW